MTPEVGIGGPPPDPVKHRFFSTVATAPDTVLYVKCCAELAPLHGDKDTVSSLFKVRHLFPGRADLIDGGLVVTIHSSLG